jgi:NDP-sugar pyrophosphorylase family protein
MLTSHVTEIFVVAPREYYSRLSQELLSYLEDDNVLIEIIQVNELFGTADAVRAVHDRIRGDFIVYNSDTLSQINLTELVQTHRLQSSDVTMLLAVAPLEESEKKGVPPILKVSVRSELLQTHSHGHSPSPIVFRFMQKTRNTLESVMMVVLF